MYTYKPTSDNCNNVIFLFTRFKSIVLLNSNSLSVFFKTNPVQSILRSIMINDTQIKFKCYENDCR